MVRSSGGKRETVFFVIVFAVFYLITASIIPYSGVKMEFLSALNGEYAQNSVKPDILLALVICSAIFSSRRRTVILGIIFGFIVDVTCSVPMFSSLCYCLCGHYAKKFSYTFSGKGVINAMLVALPLLLIKSVTSTFYLLGAWHNISFKDILFSAILPEYIYNVIAVAVVYAVLSLLMKLARIEKTG